MLFTDDFVLVRDSRERQHKLIHVVNRHCRPKANVSKTVMM